MEYRIIFFFSFGSIRVHHYKLYYNLFKKVTTMKYAYLTGTDRVVNDYSVPAFKPVDHGVGPRSGQTNDYEMGKAKTGWLGIRIIFAG